MPPRPLCRRAVKIDSKPRTIDGALSDWGGVWGLPPGATCLALPALPPPCPAPDPYRARFRGRAAKGSREQESPPSGGELIEKSWGGWGGTTC